MGKVVMMKRTMTLFTVVVLLGFVPSTSLADPAQFDSPVDWQSGGDDDEPSVRLHPDTVQPSVQGPVIQVRRGSHGSAIETPAPGGVTPQRQTHIGVLARRLELWWSWLAARFRTNIR